MDNVQKKVLLDLFAAPSTIVPIVGGLSAWMLSWAIDGSWWLNLGGLVAVLGGAGLLATRLIFGLESITEDAYRFLQDQQRQQRNAALDALENKLGLDNEFSDQTDLRQLRSLYDGLHADLEQGQVSPAARAIVGNVEKLFQAAVKHLEHSYHLWETAAKVTGEPRRKLLAEREHVLQEVRATAEHLGKTIHQFQTFRVKQNETELTKLREELDETLRSARRAEERLATLGEEKSYDTKEFESP
jgi:hypothetical protein